MSVPGLLALNLGVAVAGMVLLWLLSIRLGDPSFIDAAWGIGFVVIAWVTKSVTHGDPVRSWVIVTVTSAWGLRLGTYLLWRWRRSGPDPRYRALQRRAQGNVHIFTLRNVFLLQAAMMWIVSLPVQLGPRYAHPHGLTPWGVVGLLGCAIGIAFETVGDAQLVRFKSDPAHATAVLDRGLWRYTRHPNYFGDCCTWWGLFLVAVVNPVTALAVVGPAMMTFLLLRWSGVTVLESRLKRHRPGYDDYVRRTSTFLPRPPRTRE